MKITTSTIRITVKTVTRLLLAVLFFASFASTAGAQDYRQTAETTLSWRPAAGENGVDASVQFRVTYDTFFGEPTVKVVAEATKGNTIYYGGRQLSREEVGEEAWESIDFGPLNFKADIYQGNRRLSTVQFTNVIGMDVAASPDWDEVFPGLSEEQAKDVFRQGFQIRNIRLTGLSVTGMYGVERFLREKQTDADYAAAEQAAQARPEQPQVATRGTGSEAESAEPARSEAPQRAAGGLTPNEQQRFHGAIAAARRYEQAGNYTLAISQYQYAYGLSPQPWIRQRVSRLASARAAAEERERAQTEENARQLAEGMKAVGGMIEQHEALVDYDDPRVFQLYGGFLFGYSEASSTTISSGTGAGVLGGAEMNLWLGEGGPYNLGGQAGTNFSFGLQLEDEDGMKYRSHWYTYDYAVKLGWSGHVEVGHGARTYSQTFASTGTVLGESGVTVDATEGITFLSIGNFKRKGGSWRLSYLTTTGMALLGGGSGLVSEQVLMFERWPRSMGSWRIGLQGFQTQAGGLDWDDATYFIGYGIDIR